MTSSTAPSMILVTSAGLPGLAGQQSELHEPGVEHRADVVEEVDGARW